MIYLYILCIELYAKKDAEIFVTMELGFYKQNLDIRLIYNMIIQLDFADP